MTYRLPTLATALTLAFSVLGQASASEVAQSNASPQGSTVPGVISIAYQNPRIAMQPADVLRQGGLAVAGAVRWLPAAPAGAEAMAKPVKIGAL